MSRDKDENKRKRILQAAGKVFTGKGYLDCKISDIAREAGVADGTIYLYYRDKKALLEAVFEAHLSEFLPRMRQAISAAPNALARIRVFIETHLEFLSGNRELSRSFYVENTSPSFQEYLNLLSESLREGQRDGLLRRELNPALVKRVLLATLSSLELSVGVSACAEQVYELLVGGMLNRSKEASQTLGAMTSLSAA